MEYIRLGKTNILASKISLGIENLRDDDESATLIQKAYDDGVNFFDASANFGESERLASRALYHFREHIFLSTKSNAKTAEQLQLDIEKSLQTLGFDCIDIYQIEYTNENFLLREELEKVLQDAKSRNAIKHIGAVTEDFLIAKKILETDFYETLQFPFNMIASDEIIAIAKMCETTDVGLLAMRPLCGGVLSNIPLAFGFYLCYENAIPLWGCRTREELSHILYFNDFPPVLDARFINDIKHAREFFN